MDISTKGLIIKEQNIGENDKLITILTENQGVIRAFVQRANSIKNKNLSSTGLLTLSRFLLYKGRDKYIVKEASSVEVFFELRKDIEKLALAQYFCEIILSINITGDESKELLSLALNSIYLLCKDKMDNEIIKSVFELKSSCIIGFMPDLVCCKSCKAYESDIMYFLFDYGIIYCSSCYDKDKSNTNVVQLPPATLMALRHIIYSSKNRIFNFSIKGSSKEILNYTTERYLKVITNKEFKTLDFYKTISN